MGEQAEQGIITGSQSTHYGPIWACVCLFVSLGVGLELHVKKDVEGHNIHYKLLELVV